MSGASTDPRLLRKAPPRPLRISWSDERFRNIIYQVIVVAAVISLFGWLWSNTRYNLEVRRIATGWGFLSREAGLPIGEHLIDYDPSMSYFRALLVGVLNTLKVAIIGIILATILGTLLGVARLSKNWMLAKFASAYVEIVRDLPLLLQLLFWYSLLQGLPGPRQAFNPVTGVFLSNRGLKIPYFQWESAHSWALLAFVVGLVITYLYRKSARAKQMQDGQIRPIWPTAISAIVGLPIVVWAALGAPFTPDIPELRGFNFRGGLDVSPEFFALLLGLTLYTAGFIAEIVRAGILAVSQGQWEAAQALGLQRGRVMNLIVLPQAMRVIIPPMTSQFLNITKNSSLAVAIGYQDIVSIANTTLNQTGQAIEGIAIIMLVYLTISLSISLFMNWYNKRIALVER
ncbi:amino acid ABC transporter permease [Roseococcus sp.]|uniref:amino acid ABC transporter permease n=1 Tax=Roseococcus sp. TaxID=2109646 RepID=UPI003BAB847E